MTDLLHNLRAMRAHAAQRDWRTLDEAIAEIERLRAEQEYLLRPALMPERRE
jgi:hypothetical protein